MPTTRYFTAHEQPADVVHDIEGDALGTGAYAIGVSTWGSGTVFFHSSEDEITDLTTLGPGSANPGIPVTQTGEVTQLVDIDEDEYLYCWSIRGALQIYLEEQL